MNSWHDSLVIDKARIDAAFGGDGQPEWLDEILYKPRSVAISGVIGDYRYAYRVYEEGKRKYEIFEKGGWGMTICYDPTLKPELGVFWTQGSVGAMEIYRALVCMGEDVEGFIERFELTVSATERVEWLMQMRDKGFPVPRQ